jgi:hypothetical protein
MRILNIRNKEKFDKYFCKYILKVKQIKSNKKGIKNKET